MGDLLASEDLKTAGSKGPFFLAEGKEGQPLGVVFHFFLLDPHYRV